MNTERDFNFKAVDIITKEEIVFTLKDVIFSDDVRDSLHEEMEYIFLGERKL